MTQLQKNSSLLLGTANCKAPPDHTAAIDPAYLHLKRGLRELEAEHSNGRTCEGCSEPFRNSA